MNIAHFGLGALSLPFSSCFVGAMHSLTSSRQSDASLWRVRMVEKALRNGFGLDVMFASQAAFWAIAGDASAAACFLAGWWALIRLFDAVGWRTVLSNPTDDYI